MEMGLREANQQFARAMRAVRAGQEVVLTERGRPIAVIKPLAGGDAEEAALRALYDSGRLTPAVRSERAGRPRWKPAAVKGQPLSRTIIEDWEERI